MKPATKKQIVDLIPLVILVVIVGVSWINMLTSNIILQWQHYLGLFFLGSTIYLLFKNHQAGVLFLGLTFLTATSGIISFTVGISRAAFSINISEIRIPLFSGSPIMLLLFILHFILSNRFYTGIITKKYWNTLTEEVRNKQKRA